MAITKNGEGVIVETPIEDADQFLRTGVMSDESFAVSDVHDKTKQIKLDPTPQDPNSTVTIKSGASGGNIVVTLPAASGTLATTDGNANSFATIQTPAGTSPTASSALDTLTLTSSDSTVTITGNSTTDTVNFQAASGLPTGGTTDQLLKKVNATNYNASWFTPSYVVGPASATDNAVPVFDGTTGKIIKERNNGVTIASNGFISAWGFTSLETVGIQSGGRIGSTNGVYMIPNTNNGGQTFQSWGTSAHTGGMVRFENNLAANPVVVIKAIASQTGALQEWRDSANTVVSSVDKAGIKTFRSYTVVTLPAATTAGQMIYVSDETGGPVMAFSDGTNWRRVTDRAIVA